jgi:hypothetical protein
MYNYLDTITADYTTETLNISPQQVMKIPGTKAQVVHKCDDGSVSVVSESDTSAFQVQCQWNHISETDHATIMDFYHDSSKANGMENTFKWLHPVDGYTYVVRFLTDLSSRHYPYPWPGIQTITLAVEGVSA